MHIEPKTGQLGQLIVASVEESSWRSAIQKVEEIRKLVQSVGTLSQQFVPED